MVPSALTFPIFDGAFARVPDVFVRHNVGESSGLVILGDLAMNRNGERGLYSVRDEG